MRKLPFISVFAISILLTSCDTFNHQITLHFDNDQKSQVIYVKPGADLPQLDSPTRENSKFSNWFTDINLTHVFSQKQISSNLNLYAGYDFSEDVDSSAKETALPMTFTIYNRQYLRNSLINKEPVSVSQGSGVIFQKSDNTYYVLTNNHVVYNKPSNYITRFSVKESKLIKEYSAQVLYAAAQYDLALMSFQTTDVHPVVSINTKDEYKNRLVIAAGTPNGQYNTITYGKTEGYSPINKGDDVSSQVDFPVLLHSAELNVGNSGGPLFDYKFDLVAINYALVSTKDKSYYASIPAKRVSMFLEDAKKNTSEFR